MNRIDIKFKDLRSQKRSAFIAYLTAGFPNLKMTEELAISLGNSGADIIELGVPFSDPQADGPTIQEASYQALQKGVSVQKILQIVKKIRAKSEVPIALMTYFNPVFHYGEDKFVKAAKAAGVDGLIIPDLPVDEAQVLRKAAQKADVSLVFFLAPTTTKDRMKDIVKASSGFVYFVSVAGVTGARQSTPVDIKKQVRFAQTLAKTPVCVGFGVSTPEQVKSIGKFSDGVIVGSAIIKEIQKHQDKPDMVKKVSQFVRTLACL